MSKGEGRNIVIKFTDDITTEDIGANKSAFKVSGKEYKYVNGLLIDKEYQVEKVERYPIQRIWELGEGIELNSQLVGFTSDLVPKMASNTSPSGVVTYSRQNNDDRNAAFRVFDDDNETRWSTGSSPSYPYGWIAYEFTSQQLIKKYTVRAHPTNGSSAPKNWTFEGWDGERYVVLDEQNNVTFTNGEYKEFAIDNNQYYAKYRLDVSQNGGAAFLGISELELMGGMYEYTTPKIHTSQAINLLGSYRMRWVENKPENTDILIEYTTGQTQGQWQTVSNGEVINIDTNLWIRVTLSTEDTAITPILQDLWLEEASEPQDRILITMDWWGKFNNSEGPLTVEYDAAKGNLSGQGGAVESFIETFTPTDLIPEPNPNEQETIEIAPVELTVDLLPVEYVGAYNEETITVAPVELTVELIHISIINP